MLINAAKHVSRGEHFRAENYIFGKLFNIHLVMLRASSIAIVFGLKIQNSMGIMNIKRVQEFYISTKIDCKISSGLHIF